MKRSKFKIGEMVQSRYRACWHGEVLEIEKIKDLKGRPQFLYTVRQLYTVDGRPQRLKKTMVLDQHWLKPSTMKKEEDE